MKSADGPLGGPIIPLCSPAPWLIIGVFEASSHSGCRQKDRKLGLVAFTDWTWSYSNEDRNAPPFPPEMAKNFISWQEHAVGCVCVCVCVLCLCARGKVERERGRDEEEEEGERGGSTWHVSACVPARLIVPVPVLCKYV